MSNSLRVRSRSAPSTVTMRVSGFSRTPWCSSQPSGRILCLGSARRRRGGRGRLRGDVVARPPQHRVDARAQFARPERLGDVVVGARLEPLQCVDLLGACAEHDDVGRAGRADPLGGLEAVHAGHVDVEGRDERLMLQDEVEAVLPVGGAVHGESGLREDGRQKRSDVFLILDHDCDARFFHRCTFRRRRPDRRRPDVGHDIPERGLELPVRVAHRRADEMALTGLRVGREASPRASAPADARWTVLGWRSPPRSPSRRTETRSCEPHHGGAAQTDCHAIEQTPHSRVHLPSHILPQTPSEDPLFFGLTTTIRRWTQALLRSPSGVPKVRQHVMLDACHSSPSPEASPRANPRSPAASPSTAPSSSTRIRSSATCSSPDHQCWPRSPRSSATGCCAPTARSIARASGRSVFGDPARGEAPQRDRPSRGADRVASGSSTRLSPPTRTRSSSTTCRCSPKRE